MRRRGTDDTLARAFGKCLTCLLSHTLAQTRRTGGTDIGKGRKAMKTILFAAFAVAMIANPASACFEAARYGTFTLGSYGTSDYMIGGDEIGSYGKVRSNQKWDFDGNVYIDQCSHHADFNAALAKGKWPNSRAKIQHFFQGQANKCASYFRDVHERFAGQLCK